jgi:hypothetical protein
MKTIPRLARYLIARDTLTMTDNGTPPSSPSGGDLTVTGFGTPPPPTPKMGGISGGALNLTWTKLEKPPVKPYHLLCLQPVKNESALKAMIHITKPPTT